MIVYRIDGLDAGAVPASSTIYTPNGVYVYGAEIGSTDVVKVCVD